MLHYPKNVWLGRFVGVFVGIGETLTMAALPVLIAAERVIRAAGNVFGTLAKKITCGRICKTYTLAKAGTHLKEAALRATLGTVAGVVLGIVKGLIHIVGSLVDPLRESQSSN